MSHETFMTKIIGAEPDAEAPDGPDVRLLLEMTRGSMAHFALSLRKVSRAVAHKTIEEIWYFLPARQGAHVASCWSG
jgi:hypothetical protein